MDATIKDNSQGMVASRCLIRRRPHKMENKVPAAARCRGSALQSSLGKQKSGTRFHKPVN